MVECMDDRLARLARLLRELEVLDYKIISSAEELKAMLKGGK